MQKTIQIEEDNNSFYIVIAGERWMRTTSREKAQELAVAFELADEDPDIQFVK